MTTRRDILKGLGAAGLAGVAPAAFGQYIFRVPAPGVRPKEPP